VTTPKDRALQTLGRVVVNFQRLEHILKVLAGVAPIFGNLEAIDLAIEQRREETGRLTLGSAVKSWRAALSGELKARLPTPDLFSITAHCQVQFKLDRAIQDAHLQGLTALVKERNGLMHGMLAQFPWESEPDCDELTAYLESLIQAIEQHMHYLQPILASLNGLGSGTIVIEQGNHERAYRAYVLPPGDT